jgi:hypothetical protein
MESFPSAIVDVIQRPRPLLRAAVFTSFSSLMLGILLGEAKDGTARARVCAGPTSWPQRRSDRWCRPQRSPPACMAQRAAGAGAGLSPPGRPARLLWMADSTSAEQPDAKRVASVGVLHRTTRVAGHAQHRPGHGSVCAAHLSTQARATRPRWARVRVGTVVDGQGRSLPALGGVGAQPRRRPSPVRPGWLVDRGLRRRPLRRALAGWGQRVVGRVRGHQVVSCAPTAAGGQMAPRQRWPRG